MFVGLSQGSEVGLVNSRLYLPRNWTENRKRCEKAGIPLEAQGYKSKPVLAMEMIGELSDSVQYDWVGGDSIYGNSPVLRQGLTQAGKLFVMDVSEEQMVYLHPPMPYVPKRKASRGRNPSRYVSAATGQRVKTITDQLPQQQCKTYTFRHGTKGSKTRQVAVVECYVWTAKFAQQVEHVRLVVSRNTDGTQLKYSLTNDVELNKKCSTSNLLYKQMQRYWVERAFQDIKDVLGMTDYQVRKWKAWHHHIALTMMALQYMIEQKIKHAVTVPLLSCPDIKFILAMNLPRKINNDQQLCNAIDKRHAKRRKDIQRYADLE